MVDLEISGTYRFDRQIAKELFKKRSLRLLFIQGFFGVFPWNAITIWIFFYLSSERNFSEFTQFVVMAIAVVILALGYPLGGMLGDYFFNGIKEDVYSYL